MFLPIVFYCLTNSVCMFDQGVISTNLQACISQNEQLTIRFKAEPMVKAFETDCIDLTKPRKVDNI
jgi:hypothetical protein